MFNIISFGKKRENLVLAIEHQIIGSTMGTFKENVHDGSTIFLHCASKIWATAEISGDYFVSDSLIWADKTYPHRFKFKNCNLLSSPVELSDGVINSEFRKSYGTAWAYRFLFTPKPIPQNIAALIQNRIRKIKITDLKNFKLALYESEKN